uniref:Uncharacterized protein n=1 Tax=Anopheles christyi TaxID=43041 RepID=A0A182KI47_9DIPT
MQMLAVIQIPQEGATILATRRAQRTIGRHGHRVEVSIVSEMVDLQLAVGQIPNLHHTIPTCRHDDRIGVVRRESYTRHPVRVSVFLNGVLTLSQSVPQLDRLVTRSRDNLTIIYGESNR